MKKNPVYRRLLKLEITLILFLLVSILVVKSCFRQKQRESLHQTQQDILLTEPVALLDDPPSMPDAEDKSQKLNISSGSRSSQEEFSVIDEAVGFASYYQDVFLGHPTASGETYDPAQYTAAHRELPFGAHVRVTNMANGKQVTVRINDRGPLKRERIIDLSGQAARALGIFQEGTAQVKLEVLE